MEINFRNVEFKYSKKALRKTLDNICLEIAGRDEFIAILGHTGSGKSTLVQHMNGILLPTGGELIVYGKTIRKSKNLRLKDIRAKIGLVFQFPEYQLFEETVLKDIMFGPKNFGMSNEEAKKLAIESAKLLSIDEELLERSPFSLSGGQMRRVAIAGILASQPDVLILDEPTVGLDPKGKKELLELLIKIQKETHKSIIMVTHDMNVVARYAKRTIVIKDGVIVYDGKMVDLFNDPDKLRDYNLDLPESARLALALNAKGLVKFDRIPLTKEALLEIILKSNGDYSE